MQKKLEKFTKTRKSFVYKGKLHFFTISLGYAEYPTHAENRNGLMQCADAALYGVKQKVNKAVWFSQKVCKQPEPS